MSQDNRDAFNRGTDAYNRRDFEAWLGGTRPGCGVAVGASNPAHGGRRGIPRTRHPPNGRSANRVKSGRRPNRVGSTEERSGRMRHAGLASVGVAAVALLGAAGAAGRGPAPIPTKVLSDFHGSTNGPNEFVLSASGPLQSRVAKCEAGRTVKLFFRTAGGARRLVDVDRSSRSGEWGVFGRASFMPTAFIVEVTRAHVQFHHRRRTCGANRLVVPVQTILQPRAWAP